MVATFLTIPCEPLDAAVPEALFIFTQVSVLDILQLKDPCQT